VTRGVVIRGLVIRGLASRGLFVRDLVGLRPLSSLCRLLCKCPLAFRRPFSVLLLLLFARIIGVSEFAVSVDE
jgi:hypothetical protein